jgi:hypothetical protein
VLPQGKILQPGKEGMNIGKRENWVEIKMVYLGKFNANYVVNEITTPVKIVENTAMN